MKKYVLIILMIVLLICMVGCSELTQPIDEP